MQPFLARLRKEGGNLSERDARYLTALNVSTHLDELRIKVVAKNPLAGEFKLFLRKGVLQLFVQLAELAVSVGKEKKEREILEGGGGVTCEWIQSAADGYKMSNLLQHRHQQQQTPKTGGMLCRSLAAETRPAVRMRRQLSTATAARRWATSSPTAVARRPQRTQQPQNHADVAQDPVLLSSAAADQCAIHTLSASFPQRLRPGGDAPVEHGEALLADHNLNLVRREALLVLPQLVLNNHGLLQVVRAGRQRSCGSGGRALCVRC